MKGCLAGVKAAKASSITCPDTITTDAGADYVEPTSEACGSTKCIHADWRNHDPNTYNYTQ